MKSLRCALCALVFVCAAQARPVVIEEIATLAPPDSSWQYFGRSGVAIDEAFTVTPGTWYRVRVEIVNGLTRVFVDDQLQLSTSADPGPATPFVDWNRGSVGLVTYKGTADFDSFLAYQP